ncbi:MAG TPA: primosomal protein N', partial [Planctomycetaceae bacterium]|nr:primosomal protein N' [Planctomycetaceae bacterium]
HGITGSGKTEVYIRAIEEVIHQGRQAIVLVPEISLTPQTRQRFRSRFERVAVLHSHLSASERHWQWQRIVAGDIDVVVGARSAIFAPTPKLGLIILDEEHDASFKQDNVPRYQARDVALKRARIEQIPLVLGSATPSLESWQQAQQGRFELVRLPQRVLNRPLPDVATIDLRNEQQTRGSSGAIGRQMHQEIQRALRDAGQVILLLNRRGFSTSIQCPQCGHVVKCDDCDIALTHHREKDHVRCHYCDYQATAPARCPECQFDAIRYAGLGTQKLEAEVRRRFPEVSVLRMDSDSMQRPGSHEQALARFRAGDVQILVGTQMIAKGLDFPNVTLVGVINADTALHFPDFRAAERTFQLVTQVAGRTGRGDKGGRVLVQTFSPEHPAIQAATRHDYRAFADTELPIRQQFAYPPFGRMIRLVMQGPQEKTTEIFSEQLSDQLTAAIADSTETVRLLGPAPAPISKLRGRFRFHLLLQAASGKTLRSLVAATLQDIKCPGDLQLMIDVDPLSLL